MEGISMKKSMILLVLFTVVACSPRYLYEYEGNKNIVNKDIVSRIKKNNSTMKEVASLLGDPTHIYSIEGGSKIWVYNFSEAEKLPIIQDVRNVSFYTLTIQFSSHSIVRSVESSVRGKFRGEQYKSISNIRG